MKPTQEIGLWTSITEGRDNIGAFLNRGEFGIEAFDADDVSLGTFYCEDDAYNAIADCWDKKSRSNGGDPHVRASEESGLEPEPPPDIANDPLTVAPVAPEPTPDPRQPATYQINLAETLLPAALIPLTTQLRWVCWRWEWRKGKSTKGKWTKPPIQPGNGFPAYAKNNDPATWGTFAEAVQRVTQGGADGIGFCLLGSDVAAVDLDHCRDRTAVTAWALDLAGRAPENTYCEVTVSGEGLRLIGLGTGHELHRKFPAADGKGSFELYRNAARYITISGRVVVGATGPLPKIDNLLDELLTEASRTAPEPNERDETGSGYGFRFMQECHAKGMSYEQARMAILADKTIAGEWANRVDERQLARAWENSKPAPEPPPGKKPSLIVELGARLWGPATVNGQEYRFGVDQSKVIDPRKGVWFDFTTNKGGHIRDLMKKVAAEENRKQPNADDVVTVCAADVVMRPLDWVWEGHLLRGSQELMSGLPDLSKSTVQIGYIACATARLPWPDGAPAVDPMNVIMLTAEDTLDQIVVPRLRAAGADISRVAILKCIKTDQHERQFLLAEDLDRLERLVRKIGAVGLITVDPITAYMGGKMDSYKATEVRSQLGPLKDFGERMNIALATITHPPKAAGPRAIDHFIASQAFIAACRVGHLCIAEMEEKDGERVPTGRVLFTNVRNSAHRLMPTLAYRKEEFTVSTEPRLITAPRVIWEGSIDITAEAAIAAVSGKKQPDQQREVQAFLREMLKDDKMVLQKEIEEAGEAKNFTPKQLRTAREKLGVHVFKEPGKMTGPWFWQLPNPDEGRYHY
jgi:putative DNA primase/helicase